MVTEDYVPFETAKLLKEKGFDDEYTNAFYDKTGNLYFIDLPSDLSNHPNNDTDIAASTLYVAMKWLREEKNIFIDICTLNPLAYTYRVCLISDTTGYFYEDYACEDGERFMSYKEAVEFALDYCLNNILEV